VIAVDDLPDHPLHAALLEKVAIGNITLCHVIKNKLLGVFVARVEPKLDFVRVTIHHHLATRARNVPTIQHTFTLQKGSDTDDDSHVVFEVRRHLIFAVAQRFFFKWWLFPFFILFL